MIAAFAVAAALSAGTAMAGEGVGDPFPFHANGIITATPGLAGLARRDQDPFQYRIAGRVRSQAAMDSMGPGNGSEAAMQTAGSMPRGFSSPGGAPERAYVSGPPAGAAARGGHRGVTATWLKAPDPAHRTGGVTPE